MGIRFSCHHCEEELNVKDHLAGKKGRCPKCQERFRVPAASAEYSLDVKESVNVSEVVGSTATGQTHADAQEHSKTAPVQQLESVTNEVNQPGESAEALPNSSAPVGTGQDDEFNVNSNASVWYVRPPSGGEYGPATASVFQGWIQEHRVTPDSFIWKDGWPDWQLASTVLPNHFSGQAAPSATPPATPLSQPQVKPSVATFPEGQPATSPGHLSVAAASQAVATQGAEPLSISEKNRLTRKQKRKRNYTISIIVLTVLAFVLLAALVIALTMQQEA